MRTPLNGLLSSLMTLTAVASITLMSAGCPQPRSQGETLELHGHGVHVPPRPGAFAFTAEQPVLVGSRICGSQHCTVECPSVGDGGTFVLYPNVSECYRTSADGPASVDDGGCLTFDGEGAVAWNQEPAECDLASDDGGWAPTEDSFVFVATTLSGLEARFEHALEAYGAETLVSDEPEYVPTAAFPADFLQAPSDVLQLLAGEEVRLPVSLVEAGTGSVVGYRPAQVVFDLAETRAATDGGAAAEIELVPGGFPIVTMAAGGELEVGMRLGDDGTRLLVGRVRGVAAETIASLEIHSFRPEPADQASVLGVRAIARDTEGAHVYGVPVAWELGRGRYVVEDLSRFGGRRRGPDPDDSYVEPDLSDLRADWIYFNDECREPSERLGSRVANMTARFSELEATHSAQWEQIGPEPAAGNFDPSRRCEGISVERGTGEPDVTPEPEPGDPTTDCACSTAADGKGRGGVSQTTALGVMVVGWALWRRRRRS